MSSISLRVRCMSGIGGCGAIKKFSICFLSLWRRAMSQNDGASAKAEFCEDVTTWHAAHQRVAMCSPWRRSPAQAGVPPTMPVRLTNTPTRISFINVIMANSPSRRVLKDWPELGTYGHQSTILMMGESSKHAAFRPGNENMCLLCISINECSIKACAYHIWPLFSRKWKANLHLSRDCKKSAVGDERSKENHVQVIAILY